MSIFALYETNCNYINYEYLKYFRFIYNKVKINYQEFIFSNYTGIKSNETKFSNLTFFIHFYRNNIITFQRF